MRPEPPAIEPAPPSPIRPARVLLHPLWLGATVVLALNDQWMKHAGVLPEVLTGKLSDFAGMLVAPALLATMLGVATRRGWWTAHLAVGLVFTALQLSTGFAAQWSAFMGAFAFPWRVTSDPTDLIALPLLLVSARVFVPAMAMTSRRLVRRSAEATAAGVGLLCCVATSQENGGEWLPDVRADVWLHNATDEDQVVRIRELRDSVQLDCTAVSLDPAGLLAPSLFDRVQSWTLPVDANISVRDVEQREGDCTAVMIDADTFAPVVVFWFDEELPIQTLPGEGTVAGAGAIELESDDAGVGRYHNDGELLYFPQPPRVPAGVCALQDDADRIDWGDEVPRGDHRVQALVPGVDGCTAIDLLPLDDGDAERMYLCTPAIDFPFAVGDLVALRREYLTRGESLVVTVLDESRAPALPLTELWVLRGAEERSLPGLLIGVAPMYECGWSSDPCGAAVRPVSLAIGGPGYDAAHLQVGDAAVTLDSHDERWTIALAHAQERAAIDDACSAGTDGLGFDIELVAVHSGVNE